MHGFLDWRFPAADIPAQARALYAESYIRLVPDVDFSPSQLVVEDGGPEASRIDLTYSHLRSVSPVHVTYLRNMGVRASMSVSVMVQGQLWGLVACHHATPWFVQAEQRRLVELLAQSFSSYLSSLEQTARANRSQAVQSLVGDVIQAMRSSVAPIDVLFSRRGDLARMMNADGLIVRSDKQSFTFGDAPTREALRLLMTWLTRDHGDMAFVADSAPDHLGLDSDDSAKLGGILACPMHAVKDGWIVWLRCERRQTYKWAGNPGKAVEVDAVDFRVTPRASFALYEAAHAKSAEPWSDWETVSASLIAQAISETVTRHELERSNQDLEQFAYAASHDLQEPLRSVAGYADLLQRRYADSLDEKAQHYVKMISGGADRLKALVEGLLHYARVSSSTTPSNEMNLGEIVQEAIANSSSAIDSAGAIVRVGDLPTVVGQSADLVRVFQNLIANAIKFRRDVAPIIHVTAERTSNMWTVSVADNGLGIEPAMQEHVFIIFRRADVTGTVPGLGLGLAMCKRIIQRHGGRIWVESNLGEGSTFRFTLPAVH
jgi:chemotaxis family two-component system sensor kinase Cph1